MRGKTYRPQLEQLEDRTVPTILSGHHSLASLNIGGSGNVQVGKHGVQLSGDIHINNLNLSGCLSWSPCGGVTTSGSITHGTSNSISLETKAC